MGNNGFFPAAFLLLSLAAGPASVGAGPCGSDWSWANPLPQGNSLQGIASDGTTVLAVGNHGTVVRFSGSDYTVGDVGHPYILTSVVYGSGRWVAAGFDPASATPIVTTSENGAVWTTRLAGGVGAIFGLARGDTLFAAVGFNWDGNQDLLFTSSDGLTWTFRPTGTQHVLTAVAFGGGRFVATSESGVFLTSTDGISWATAASFPGLEFTSITFAAGKFVAAGHDWTGGHALFASSTDGLSWTPAYASPDVNLRTVCFGGGQFLAAGWEMGFARSRCFGSPDGATWNVLAEIPHGWVLAGVYSQSRFHLVGTGGLLLWSGDGSGWVKASTGLHRGWSDVADGSGVFVAVGEAGYLSTSLDGETWNPRSFSDEIHLRGVAFADDRFVAVGDGGDVKYSGDGGSTWYYGVSGTTATLLDVASTGHAFLATGTNGTLLASDTGETWTPLPSLTTHHINGVACGQGVCVAVTDQGESIWIGPFGPVLLPTGSSDSLRAVAFGANRYVAVGEGGRIVTLDSNGSAWIERSSGVADDLYAVAFASGTFVAAAWSTDRQESVVLTSPDGETWTVHNPGVGHPLLGAGGGRGLLLAVGNGGTILKSACPPTLSSLSPSRGSTAGGNPVFLSGTGLAGADAVTFDGLPTSFTETADGRLEALAPAHAAGPVSVLARNLGGWSSPQTYTYVDPPVISSVVKKTNPFRLVVSGRNFKNPCTVYAGGTAVPTTTYKSATKVVAKGSTLKSLFPKGLPVEVTVVNDADGIPSTPYLFSR
jgi:hypothetical protein